MKKILVPTDFSEQSENALRVAAQLARKHQAEIYILHVVELPIHAATDVLNSHTSPANFPEAVFFLKLAKQRFRKFVEKDFLKDIDVHEVIETQTAFNGIMDTTKNTNIDLIIMGSHGASGMKEMFIGSNTEKVVRNSDVPVLVVKQDHKDFKIDEMIFATDFDEQSAEVVSSITAFAQLFDAKIRLLYINTANNFRTTAEIEEAKHNFLNKTGLNDFSDDVYNDHKVEWGILNYMKTSDADVIAIATHGRKGLAHFFNGSISEDLVNHAHRPVITFKI